MCVGGVWGYGVVWPPVSDVDFRHEIGWGAAEVRVPECGRQVYRS